MTTEEKLRHFYAVSMETARDEAEKAIAEYKSALDAEMEQHKQEKQVAAQNQFKIESENAAREINKALSAENLHIKRLLSKKQQEIREKLFSEVESMLEDFTETPAYLEWLIEKAKKALEIAGDDDVQIYLAPSDLHLADELQKAINVVPLISDSSFQGGIKAVIPEKNILIDYTLLTLFENEKENFHFDGGLKHE